MTILFKAKTNEAYYIKVLAELLSNNLKTGCFEIYSTKILLTMMDHHRKTLIKLELLAENFSLYKFKKDEPLFVGLNLNHLHKMLKTIKKKDSIQFSIDDSDLSELSIKVIPKENSRVTTSFIKIQNIQNLDIEPPEGYSSPVIVISSEFQKMCKDMSSIGNNIKIIAKKFNIMFCCNSGEILKRNVEFGEDSDSDSDSEESKEIIYDNEFNIEQLSRITKIASLSSTLQIFPADGLPLLFKSNIGTIGKISIYIKSKELILNEQNINPYDSE